MCRLYATYCTYTTLQRIIPYEIQDISYNIIRNGHAFRNYQRTHPEAQYRVTKGELGLDVDCRKAVDFLVLNYKRTLYKNSTRLDLARCYKHGIGLVLAEDYEKSGQLYREISAHGPVE